jgi:hypothetical protein
MKKKKTSQALLAKERFLITEDGRRIPIPAGMKIKNANAIAAKVTALKKAKEKASRKNRKTAIPEKLTEQQRRVILEEYGPPPPWYKPVPIQPPPQPPPPPLPINWKQESLIEQRKHSRQRDTSTNLPLPTIRLQLYGRDRKHCIPEYSIIDNLLYDLTCDLSEGDLTCHERLFIIHSIGRNVHESWLATLYLQCGCFPEAGEIYLRLDRPRKLGDICWAEGRLDETEAWYLHIKEGGKGNSSHQQVDRLLKLAFFRERWAEVLPLFEATPFSKYSPPERIYIGSFEHSAKTSLKILAGAITRLSTPTPPPILKILKEIFGLSEKQWSEYLNDPAHHDEAVLAETKERCRPMICRTPPLRLLEALKLGKTARSRRVTSFIRSADQRILSAQRALEKYGRHGKQDELERFLRLTTESGISTFCKSMLFAATGHYSYLSDDSVPRERRLQLSKVHPSLEREYGRLVRRPE